LLDCFRRALSNKDEISFSMIEKALTLIAELCRNFIASDENTNVAVADTTHWKRFDDRDASHK